MWPVAPLALSLLAAQPAPGAFVEIRCPWFPIFFDTRSADLNASARHILDGPFLWFRQSAADEDVRIVLRTYTNGEPDSEIGRLSEARADAVRTALIERRVPADHILISHTFSNEPRMVERDWIGGWIYPEYYMTREGRDRLFPDDGSVC